MANYSMSLVLDEKSAEIIDEQVRQGRFGTASEVVRAGLELLVDENAKLDELRAALEAGENSGVSERSVDDIWQAVLEKHGLRDA